MTALAPPAAASAARLLDAVEDHVRAALVPSSALERVRAALEDLPAQVVAAAYLECRLAKGADDVDLVVRVDAGGRGALAGSAARRREPVWRRLAELCGRWDDATDIIGRALSHLWLEFDLGAGDEPLPPPSIFVSTDRRATAGWSDSRWMRLYVACGEVLVAGGLDGPSHDAVRLLVASRPGSAWIPHLGFMTARPGGGVRVYAHQPAVDELRTWACAAGCECEPTVPGVARVLWPRVGLAHLDVASGRVLPRLGVEMTFERRPQLRGEVAEAAFVRALAGAGLCSRAKADALLGWPGVEPRALPHEPRPSWFIRRLNCVKLVHRPGLPVEAKAYLLTLPHPIGRRR